MLGNGALSGEVLARTSPDARDLVVALAAGAARGKPTGAGFLIVAMLVAVVMYAVSAFLPMAGNEFVWSLFVRVQ
mgnify:CR=1 FL=1